MTRAIAIVSMAGRFPAAPSAEALWSAVVARSSAAVDVSAQWPIARSAALSSHGGVDRTRSPIGCPLAPFEVRHKDLALSQAQVASLSKPTQLALDIGVSAFRSAQTTALDLRRVGAIFGNIALPTDADSLWAEQLFSAEAESAQGVVPRFESTADPALCLAEALGLGGPAFTIDAACASSLYSLYLASLELDAGRLDAVIAGGISMPQMLYTQIGFTQLNALSPTGRCAPFTEHADGLLVGEGGALFVLKRLDDALASGDEILAVLRGIGVSNDRRGSLLSPDSEGQERAVRAAFADANWNPASVDLIECHGTGTPRGDAVEIETLRRVYEEHARPRPLTLSSVKSNIGHLLTGAGAAALAKTIQALKHQQLPPTAHFAASTSSAALRSTSFEVLESAQPWPQTHGQERRAALSGFGFGGINAHVLVESYAPRERTHDGGSQRIESQTAKPKNEYVVVGFGSVSASEQHTHSRSDSLAHSGAGSGMEHFDFESTAFHIPPNEIDSVLPQQLLVLQSALEARRSLRGAHSTSADRVGVVVGLGLDLETTSFHVHWCRSAHARVSAQPQTLNGAALNASRTQGALGGIVASRLAREFDCAGPSFGVSSGDRSGTSALRVATQLIESGRIDSVYVAAVDLCFDRRNVRARQNQGQSLPTNEGAAVLIIKTKAQALADGDSVYLTLPNDIVSTPSRSEKVPSAGVATDLLAVTEQCRLEQQRSQPQRPFGLFVVSTEAQREALLRLASTSTQSIDQLAAHWHNSQETPAISARAVVAHNADDLAQQLKRTLQPSPALRGKLAFVFPGSGSDYRGMGAQAYQAFPELIRAFTARAPRSARYLADQDNPQPEQQILRHVAHGIFMHDALKHCGVLPNAYIGYSLGESMGLLASGAWANRDEMCERTESSPLFRSQLSGENTVLKSAWGDNARWRVVVVPLGQRVVRPALVKTASLLIVNAPNECVIGGDATDVEATLQRLNAVGIPVDGVPTVHLGLANEVADAYRALHMMPTTPPDNVSFYSGAWGKAYQPANDTCAQSILDNATKGFDFEATILQAYEDGVRVFVETGPNASCTRMISAILKDKPHLAVSACQQGKHAYAQLLSAIGRVIEAGIPVNLSTLYPRPKAPNQPPLRRVRIERARAEGSDSRAVVLPDVKPSQTDTVIPVRNFESPMSVSSTSQAHEAFLRFSAESLRLQLELLGGQSALRLDPVIPVALTREQCLTFAVGKIGDVLGPEFAALDAQATRVRLPAEPLMLVDRIVSIDAVAKSMDKGKLVTEHDVLPDAWYLDAGRAPVCISVEAGQADLFLSGYLGVDFHTKGDSVYRLLDAKITFHRELPKVGETIRYEISIDRFIEQGNTWLFFFKFEGTIDGVKFITMFDGCAGFFTQAQLDSGKGIVQESPLARQRQPNALLFNALRPSVKTSLDSAALRKLREGTWPEALGSSHAPKRLHASLQLPDGKMALIERVVELDTDGGEQRLGVVYAESDIAADDWYLTCHFIDDQVMPGTLMFEASLQTLRVLLLSKGFVVDASTPGDFSFAPVLGVAGQLKCRGQVTRHTSTVGYRVEVVEIGYAPEPYVIARASMFADGRHVVAMEGMSLRLRGASKQLLEAQTAATALTPSSPTRQRSYSRAQILAYAEGNPSEGFGAPYLPFDHQRRLARLPRPPFLFLDSVSDVDAEPFVMSPQGWVTGLFEVKKEAWYFTANQQNTLPYSVLLEAALQPCGWLAAYAGSALQSAEDLHFRNLDGEAIQRLEVGRKNQTLTTRARMTKASQAGGMILQEYEMQVLSSEGTVFSGTTGFGFFPSAALRNQVGLKALALQSTPNGSRFALPMSAPLAPNESLEGTAAKLSLPAQAYAMVDTIDCLQLSGGAHSLGFIQGSKRVDSKEWFFAAHFYQDPVMPGSLGIEAMIQLLKVYARERFAGLAQTHRFQSATVNQPHQWQYRGQVTPSNVKVAVEVTVTSVDDSSEPTIVADGLLSVDGRVIYSAKSVSVRLVKEAST
jgi:acyl transferase domain-containing protein/3-hydroxymyristoyl/3-hydroxydecanoyl-(acyl carrier protein) dehydratase